MRLIGDATYGDKGSIGANIPKRDNKYTFKAIEDMRALKDKYEKESKDYGMLRYSNFKTCVESGYLTKHVKNHHKQ